MGTQIKGKQIKDESITEDDIKDGSVKAAELSTEAITGQPTHTGSTDDANDMLLIYDASATALKKIPLEDLMGEGGGGEGGESSKHFAIGHVDLTTNNKPVNWINASSISASSGIKSWYIVPFAGTIDKVIVSVKANNFDNTNDGNITLSIFKNQADYGATIVNQTVGANDFSQKVSNMAGGSTDCNQKIFAGLNQAIAEGDLLHVKVGKTTGSDREAIVTMIYTS